MAQRHINTKNGSITLPTGFAGVFQSFDVNESYAESDVTVYNTSLTYGQYLTNGTPIQRVTVNGFVQCGTTGMNPGFGQGTDSDGATAILNFDTTATQLTGSYIVTNLRTSHSRSRAGVPLVIELINSGDISSTNWATS